MRCCWGISKVLPENVLPRLPRGTTYSYPDTVEADVLIVPGIDTLRRIWSQVRDQDVAVLVFDADVKLKSWSIPPLDLTVPLGKQLRSTNEIKYQRSNPINKLLKKTAKSFVSNFITLVYKTRDPEKQAKIRQEVFGAFWRGEREKLIASTNKKSTEMLTLLNSEDAVVLERALQQVKAGRLIGPCAKENKISTFDLTYVVKFMSK